MAIQTLKQIEIAQISGAAFSFPIINIFPTANGFGGTGLFNSPIGTFSGFGSADPTNGGSRTVSYNGIFGSYSNTAGFGPNGPSFSGFPFSF
jgi:hypothetical protein